MVTGLEKVNTAFTVRHTLSSGLIFTIIHNLTQGLRNTRNVRNTSSGKVKVTLTHHSKRMRTGRGATSEDSLPLCRGSQTAFQEVNLPGTSHWGLRDGETSELEVGCTHPRGFQRRYPKNSGDRNQFMTPKNRESPHDYPIS